MGTLIKIVIALVILTASFNAARFSLNNYQFEDAVHEGLLFDPYANDAQIVDMVTKIAAEYQVPLAAEDIVIKQLGSDIVVEMSYTDTVPLLPGIYSRDWTFTPSTSTRMLVGNRRR